MGLQTGCNGQCCFTEGPPDANICFAVLGDLFTNDQTTFEHESCFTRIADTIPNADCVGCDVGCDPGIDTPDQLIFQAAGLQGNRFLRPHPVLHCRDAKGRIVDLVANEPILINRQCTWQHGAGYRQLNAFSAEECFGFHPCELWPDEPCDQVTPENPIYVRPGYQVSGNMTIGNGYPYRPTDATGNKRLLCRKFTDAPVDFDILVRLTDYMTFFLRVGSYTGNRLIPCAANVAPGSVCDFLLDGVPSGCAGINRETQTRYAPSPCDKIFDEVVCDLSGAFIREHSYIDEEERERVALKNLVLAKVASSQFGLGLPVAQRTRFDRLDHGAAQGSNQFFGSYARSYNGLGAETIDDMVKVADLVGRTSFGNCQLTGELVITRVDVVAWMVLHLGSRRVPVQAPEPGADLYLSPHAVIEIEVDLAIRATLESGCQFAGEDVAMVIDPLHSQFPAVTPTGNSINWMHNGVSVMPPKRVRWLGQLNSFSEPAAPSYLLDPSTPSAVGEQCKYTAELLGPIVVPGTASNLDTSPADRNKHYDGSIILRFDQTNGYQLCN
ncbi:MAG: hypothetical protein ACPGXK_00275 [Phycisphaerae bacterium]